MNEDKKTESPAEHVMGSKPVAWQAKGSGGVWRYVEMPKTAKAMGMSIRPLFVSPPNVLLRELLEAFGNLPASVVHTKEMMNSLRALRAALSAPEAER